MWGESNACPIVPPRRCAPVSVGIRAANKTLLASLLCLVVPLVLPTTQRLARTASLSFVSRSKPGCQGTFYGTPTVPIRQGTFPFEIVAQSCPAPPLDQADELTNGETRQFCKLQTHLHRRMRRTSSAFDVRRASCSTMQPASKRAGNLSKASERFPVVVRSRGLGRRCHSGLW